MYALGDRPHVKTKQMFAFNPPKNEYHNMLKAYTEGGPVLADAKQGLTGYIWHCFIRDDNVIIKRIDQEEEHIIFNRAGIEQLDVTVDQNMRPFICYVVDGRAYYHHFNVGDSTYSSMPLPSYIKYPRCELDYRDPKDIPKSDIILGYVNGPKLCYALQRERYTKEHVIAEDPNKTILWRIGRLKDGTFGYQWR